MAVLRTLISLAAIAMLIQLAMAANYTVGGTNGGWDTATDLKTWATSQKFVVGDNLIFRYSSSHDVSEVSKPNYDSCQASNAIQTRTDGNTVITLSSPGKRYFICGIPGHCIAGMKVEIDTLAATSPAPASPSTPPKASPAPASPSTPPKASPAAPAPKVSPLTPPPASSAPETSSPSASPAPETSSPSPGESPKSSPKASPSPVESPKSSPKASPISPSSSPLSSPPPSPGVPAANSPSTSPPPSGVASPPQPSSAVKGVFKTTLALGFSFGIIMLLAF